MHILSRITPFVLSALLACGEKSSEDTGAMTTTAGPTTEDGMTGAEDGTTSAAPTSGGDTSNGPGETSAGATTGTPDPSTTNATTLETTAGETTAGETTAGESDGTSTGAPAGCDGDAPRVRLATTLGDMVVQLDAVNAPITVGNFIDYVESGFYVDTIFHRVIPDFVIQGGGLTASLMEKPGNPPIQLETSPALKHVDGAISMARTNDPNSATSQFFICDGPQDFLDGQYAAFGVLVEGFDVLAAITAVQTTTKGQFMDVPVEDIVILAATCE